MLTPDRGVLRATAFGAAGAKSSLRSAVQTFHAGELFYYENPAKGYAKVSDFDVQYEFSSLRADPYRLYAASLLAEIALLSAAEGASEPEGYRILFEYLDLLDRWTPMHTGPSQRGSDGAVQTAGPRPGGHGDDSRANSGVQSIGIAKQGARPDTRGGEQAAIVDQSGPQEGKNTALLLCVSALWRYLEVLGVQPDANFNVINGARLSGPGPFTYRPMDGGFAPSADQGGVKLASGDLAFLSAGSGLALQQIVQLSRLPGSDGLRRLFQLLVGMYEFHFQRRLKTLDAGLLP